MADNPRSYLFRFSGMINLKGMAGLFGRKVIFPFYHTVSDEYLPHLSHIYPYRNPAQFEADLEALLKVYHPVSIEDYETGSYGPGSKVPMLLSFDDGLIDCHRYIAPLLKEKGVPAIFFLNNDFIDNQGLFYRYLASLLIEHIGMDRSLLKKAARCLDTSIEQVSKTILTTGNNQHHRLIDLARELEFDEKAYLHDHPVYMTSAQIRDLLGWGFHLGAHGSNHSAFFEKEEEDIREQVSLSMKDLQTRFKVHPECFAFPFTSDGIPERIIAQIIDEGNARFLFGTAGMKSTGIRNFIQRIPMEVAHRSAEEVLKTEHLYYLLKAPFGRNRYF